jgi:hypothetical protein
MDHFRCPRMEAAGAEEIMAAVADVDAGYGFPAPGALCEQAAFFADALRHAEAEKSSIEAKRATAAADVRNALGSF